MNHLKEKQRLLERPDNKGWKKWGPYLAERQWGTVREDYSVYGDAWDFLSHDMSRSKAYRWGEDGIGGISDNKQFICLAFAFWNHADPILKERFFGLTNKQGNHGEDVKELYYYLDSTPTHGYMEMLYKYPIAAFPYDELIAINGHKSKLEPEYEIIDTGVFDDDAYFDIQITYAKADKNDLLIKVKAHNRSKTAAPLSILPTIWFRNTWSFGYSDFNQIPEIKEVNPSKMDLKHEQFDTYSCYFNNPDELIFCDNETNTQRLYHTKNTNTYYKDGINNYIVNGEKNAINPNKKGTKASALFNKTIAAGSSEEVIIRFSEFTNLENPFENVEEIFAQAKADADSFYADVQKDITSADQRNIQRQAFAGMMWNKQFYYYNIDQWAEGDPKMPFEFRGRVFERNYEWKHAYMANILSMPDKWEYPWFAAWDLAFHTPTLARIDPDFAKRQLAVILREYYMHPNGQIPAYEWNFSDVNPPVHAWATWKVYEIDKTETGKGDLEFLERVFHKLLLNFTWWVNQKDADGNNLFGGGFLGMDNIGVFDRNAQIPGLTLQQADATGWMALFTLNMLKISAELSITRPAYQDMASKFFEHFLYIAEAINQTLASDSIGLWDEEDEFYYDKIYSPDGKNLLLKIRSLVGLLPLCAVEVIPEYLLDQLPDFKRRLDWISMYKPELQHFVSSWQAPGPKGNRLFSLVNENRLRAILKRLFDEKEFLSDYGIRSLSKFHEANPYEFNMFGENLKVSYSPGETELNIMGGNSNWRGPIWFPLNYLILDAVHKYADHFGDDFLIEINENQKINLREAAFMASKRLISVFEKNNNGARPVNGKVDKFNTDPNFENLTQFFEYFDGDNAKGLGAAHQTGWTGLVADLIAEVNQGKIKTT
jgi:Glycosyl hydrolase family 63 C-terminal domain